MSKKKSSGKALPILSIVFFGVSMILFAAKGVAGIAFRMVTQRREYMHIMIAESGKIFAFVFPAVIFIVCAGIYLHRSLNYTKLLTAGFLMEVLSAGLLLGRLLYVQNMNGFANMNAFTCCTLACLSLIAVFSLIAAILEAKHRRKKAIIVIIAACGFAFALSMGSAYLIPLIRNFAYYREHFALLLHRLAEGSLYASAITFYYLALLFTAFYKENFEKAPEKVKVVLKSK